MSQTENVVPDRISQIFFNKTVLITGATGFLGKVLIEKLLRDCPEIRKIYAIVRPKKNLTSNERLEKILNDPLFDTVKKQTTILEKLETINGELSYADLGLNDEDRQKLIEETEIIYHCGATVKFDDPLVDTVLLNVRGTKLMLELARECKKLIVFCHTSTAFCHEDQEVVYEKFYETPADPHELIKMCETMDSAMLDLLAHWIRGNRPNNYSFSKALAEALVEEQLDRLPVILHRPSSVVSMWKEPIPGWTDNINGIIGLSAAAGKGVLRTVYGDGNMCFDFIPVDVVVHGMISSTFDFITDGSRRVYHLTNSGTVPCSVSELMKTAESIGLNVVAFDTFFWFPSCKMTTNYPLYIIKLFLYQLVPALLGDLLLRLFGYKPFLLRVQRKIVKSYSLFQYYINTTWNFDRTNFNVVIDRLNMRESQKYKIDVKGIGVDVNQYCTNTGRGLRRYIFKEKDENIDLALKRMNRMWYVDKITKTIIITGFLYYIFSCISNKFFFQNFL